MGYPAGRGPAAPARHQAGRTRPARAARHLRLGTVQTYISHILVKLEAKGRVDIVREALRRGVSP